VIAIHDDLGNDVHVLWLYCILSGTTGNGRFANSAKLLAKTPILLARLSQQG
jgi:hypothetical protein